MVLGFGCLQLFLDRGEREDWFDSTLIVTLAVLASWPWWASSSAS